MPSANRAPIYMDYQATTPMDSRVLAAMSPYWTDAFGNPHSEGHRFGWDARAAAERARSQVADFIGADDGEIVFVSGATESCNLAIRGAAMAAAARGGRRRIITLATEHPAVLDTVRHLGRNGFEAVILPVMGDGIMDMSALKSALNDDALLVSVMLANNEIGVIQPLAEVSALCRAAGAFFHTDATQAAGRMGMDVDALGVDMLSMSAHKIYGPNGVGALYVRDRADLRLEPLLTGGSQERGLRPGTVAVPLAVGFGAACEIAGAEWRDDARRMSELTAALRARLKSAFPNLRIFGHPTRRVPGNLNVGVPGVLGERLVEAVSERVAISTGAACSTGSPEPSHVLRALGEGCEIASAGVRISMGRFTAREDADAAGDALIQALKSMTGE